MAQVVACSFCFAAAPTPGNILVSSNSTLLEYTTGGAVVQSIAIPAGEGNPNPAGSRDLMLDAGGAVQIYNGTFSPIVSQYNGAAGTFSHRSPSTFSTVNNLTYGGLATGGNWIFVTDMSTAGSEERGLVRYNRTNTDPPLRISPAIEYIDVTFGFDGYVYALRGDAVNAGGQTVDKFHPVTAALLGSISLPQEQRAIAVDAVGDIFAAGTNIVHYSSTGQVIETKTDPIGGLSDIDLNGLGNIVIANHGGGVLQTTVDLDGHTVFNFRNTTGTNFAAWVAPPPTPIPEPSLGAALGMSAALVLRRNRVEAKGSVLHAR